MSDHETLAAEIFRRRRFESWADADEQALGRKLAAEPDFADAYRRVDQAWAAVGQHATSAELMALREEAIGRARRASAQRWQKRRRQPVALRIAAAVAALTVGAASAYYFAPFGWHPGEYRTAIGEQRVIELADHSRVALDAATRLQVRYSRDARSIELISGQAQFSVAKDLIRPFKVQAGTQTLVALGTVFTVEYVDREIHVAMLEGKVAAEQPNAETIELTQGQELRVRHDGRTTVIPKADLKVATAWREGKVIFNREPLGEAVKRLNRYSRQQIVVADPALAATRISGVFEAGDAKAFVEAVQGFVPAAAEYSTEGAIRLRSR